MRNWYRISLSEGLEDDRDFKVFCTRYQAGRLFYYLSCCLAVDGGYNRATLDVVTSAGSERLKCFDHEVK